jgi:MOSC domain-containing protein YiiM
MSYYSKIREKQIGKIKALFVSKKGNSIRISKRELIVDENGVWGDKFYAKEPNRSVLITSLYSYKIAEDKNISIEYGALGENILMDYNPYNLLVGTQIRIGEVILEISQNCTLCKSLTKIDNRLPKLLKDDRGVFAKVVKSGFIGLDDKIYVN